MARAPTFPLAHSVAIHSIPPVSSGYSHRLAVLPLSRALGQLCHSRPVVPAGAAALARVCGDHQFPRGGNDPPLFPGVVGAFLTLLPLLLASRRRRWPGRKPVRRFLKLSPIGPRRRTGWLLVAPPFTWPSPRFLSRGGRHGAARTHPCSPGFLAALLPGRAGAFSRASTSRLWLVTQISVSPGANNFLPAGGHFRCRPVAARAHRSAVAIQQNSVSPGTTSFLLPRWPFQMPAHCGSCPSLSCRHHTDFACG